jgi:uncharacterized protein (TIGR00725 family)
MRKPIIGVMGPGDGISDEVKNTAFNLGKLIAENGLILLNGGRNVGVMDAVSLGARAARGLTIGILPTDANTIASEGVDVAIVTGMGDARNNINVLTADVVIACSMNPGTASEVALAMKLKKPVILLKCDSETVAFFKKMDSSNLTVVESPEEAIEQVKKNLK